MFDYWSRIVFYNALFFIVFNLSFLIGINGFFPVNVLF